MQQCEVCLGCVIGLGKNLQEEVLDLYLFLSHSLQVFLASLFIQYQHMGLQ